VVTQALKGSSMLSVDEEGSRVRRTTPLPNYDTTDICRRTVVAEHLPDKPTIGELQLPVDALDSSQATSCKCTHHADCYA